MARKNRVTIPDGIYHITSRVCNRALLFKSSAVKEKIRDWIFDIAYFSGVEIYAWCIMDNHLHLLVHVPRVPERLWLNPQEEPASWAFGMRPPECFPPLWDEGIIAAGLGCAGGGPRFEVKNSEHRCGAFSLRQSRPGDDTAVDLNAARTLARPALGFMLDDEEMLDRLAALYSPKVADEIGARWQRLRGRSRDVEVEDEKARYCRRMYNVSQFVKTLKERIAMRYNAEFKHEGCLWQGRFYSGVVENCRSVLSVVAGYVDYNPVKAKLAANPEDWRFSSWSDALGTGSRAMQCREMYCKMLSCDWDEARRIMESVLNDGLPDGVTPEDIKNRYDDYDEEVPVNDPTDANDAGEECRIPIYRASQAIRCGMWFFKKGCYIGRSVQFAREAVRHLPPGFPRAGFRSIKRCRAFEWCSLPLDGTVLAA